MHQEGTTPNPADVVPQYDPALDPLSDVPYRPGTEPEQSPAVKAAMSLKAAAAARGIGQKSSVTVKTAKLKVRKPKPFEWVRVHPDGENYSIILPTLVFGNENETSSDDKKIEKPESYAIHPRLLDHPDLAEDAVHQKEYNLAITRKGTVFLWEHTVLDKENSWIDAEEENIAAARKGWIRQISDPGAGTYNRREAVQSLGEPKWPNRPFEEMLVEALGDFFVSNEQHPIFKKVLGLD